MPKAAEQDRAIALVRLIASLQRRAVTRERLPFELRIEDRMGSDMAASERERPGQHWSTPPVVFTDGRAALKALPLDDVGYAGPSAGVCCDGLPFSWSSTMAGRPLSASTVLVGFVWRVTMMFDGNRLVRLGIVRAVPPPF